MFRPVLAPLLLLGACAPAPETIDTAPEEPREEAPTEGTASFRFGIDEDYAAVMTEPPTGIFYGGIFHEEDVTDVGVTEEAVAIETFTVELALAVDGSFTEPLYTTGPLPIGKVYVLGYLDSDQNGPSTGPDQGDPVTRPGFDHRVEVLGGEAVASDVLLDMLMP